MTNPEDKNSTDRFRSLEQQVERLKRENDRLAKSREELAEIFSLSLDLLCVADINTTTFLKVNPAFVSKLGYTEEELLSRSFLDFIHPDDVSPTATMVEEKLRSGESVIHFKNRYRRSDGSYVWLDWVSRPMHERGVTYAAARDISELQQAEHELQKNQSFTKAVMDNLPLGIAVNSVDPTVNFEYMNDNFPRFYRTTREALADPDNFWEAVYEDSEFREEIKQRILEDCASGIPERMHWDEVPITRNNKQKTYYISARNTPLSEKGLMISTVWDVTAPKKAEQERQKLQEQLAQSQKMESVGRLAGGVAHDFNNMLGVILGHSEIALEMLDEEDPVRQGLQEIHNAALRSAKLTQQLLAFARKQTVTPKILDLNEVVNGMLGMLRRLIGENIILNWNPEASLWQVKIDPGQIDQIMANLSVNSRDAISGAGVVTIETENVSFSVEDAALNGKVSPGDYVLLQFSDNGKGMDKEVLSHLFDPFFTTKAQGEGTGLGLATVYGIVKQNKGFIYVYSEPGQGTIFKIYLPRYLGPEAAAQEENPPHELPGDEGPKTFLVVEDEPANLQIFKTMLERMDFHVLAAATPGEAIALARAHPDSIDLVITDVVMPEMNGRELVKRLLTSHPGIKRLFMSGYTANVIAHHGVVEEGINFIQKPFSRKDLLAKINQVLGQD